MHFSLSISKRNALFLVFYSDNTKKYLDLWTEDFQSLDEFSWALLEKFPDWQTVNVAMKQVAQKTSFDLNQNSSKVYEQYGYIKIYCSDEKVLQWNENKVAPDKRWAEIFKHMKTQNIPFKDMSSIIEYILCLPGSTAPVERIFAIIEKIWVKEKTQLHIETLRAILFVKFNMDLTCLEFSDFLKTQPELLKKIAGQAKYLFKQSTTPNTSLMSVDE